MKNTLKRAMAIVTAIALILTLFGGAAYAAFKVFPDAANHWARETIEKLSQEGIVNGYPDGTVRPDATITRSEFVSLLTYSLKLEGYTHTGPDTFDDTDKHWAESFIEALVKNKVIAKEDYGKDFKPDQPISRMEMVRMMVRSIGKADMAKIMTGDTPFVDDGQITKEDKGYINVAEKYGLSYGYPDKTVRPMAYSTRAEAFAMILRRFAAMERISQEQADNNKEQENTKPDEKSNRSNSGGGSASYPAAKVEISLPNYSHIDTPFEVKTTLSHVKNLEWTIQKKDTESLATDVLEGTLNKDGGKICIKEAGDYKITATATNQGNRKYTFSKEIKIYPVPDISIVLDDKTHIDKEVEVKAVVKDNKTVTWRLYKDGKQVKWSEYIEGNLNNDSGSISFKESGKYSLVAAVIDETNREFTGKGDIEIYPVPQLTLNMPKTAHTDSTVNVTVESKNLGNLNIVWQLEKDGKQVSLKDCINGNLTNEGGNIQFKEKGQYTLRAVVIDITGRRFEAAAPITVFPVASFAFSLPATTHTDKEIALMVTSSEIGDMKAVWSITQNGKDAALSDCIDGLLSNEGGTIRFKEKGVYTLKAVIVDPTGRVFSNEASTVVYPVAVTGFYLPEIAHTDTFVEVKTSFQETQGLEVRWSLTKDGKEMALNDCIEGTLSDNGGTIRFKEKGNYQLKAAVIDSTGRSFEYTSPVMVYPVITMDFTIAKTTHTDKSVTMQTQLIEAGKLPVVWSVIKDGIEVAVSDCIEGSLGNDGGNIRFTEKGSYTLTATIYDETGRSFKNSNEIKVYPVPQLAFTLPKAAHTDDIITVNTTTVDMDGLTVKWYVDNIYGLQDWDTYIDGTLGNNGGDIRFRLVGTYDIEASVTDETGRVFRFNCENKIEILPVLSIEFNLPQTAHTDTDIDIRTTGDMGVLPIEWSLMRNGQPAKWDESVNGTMNEQGGKIRLMQEGEYLLTATMTDALGRIFSYSAQISVYPLINCDFSMPSSVRTGVPFEVTVSQAVNLGGKDIVWNIEKDGQSIPLDGNIQGNLINHGGTVTISTPGNYILSATVVDELGRTFTSKQSIEVINTAPAKPVANANVTRTFNSGKFLVEIYANSSDPDGDDINYEYSGKAEDNYYTVGTHTVRVRAKDNFGGASDWTEVTFTVSNATPTKPTIVADVTRNAKDGKFLVNVSVTSTDADGDEIAYEYDGKAQDNYYPVGTHTVRARAKDNYGGVSEWSEVTFTIQNSAPTAPVITRTPAGNSVTPGTPVTITATSTDADGDAITYVWENRPAQTHVYPLGKNVVKVKAVDSTGAESTWSAIVFFVSDSTNGGGMVLTGPDSVIMENGLEGATITQYTFTVPPVSGHSGSDFGRVRGYNIKTKTWEQLDYRTTTNGITFQKNLPAGTYSKLEFYYYTNHNCMYNKSNITYSVNYYFE